MARSGRKRKNRPTVAKIRTLAQRAEAMGASPERVKQAGGHFSLVHETGKAQSTTVRMVDGALDRLLDKEVITRTQHAAGEQYFSDWYSSGLSPIGATDYARPIVDTSGSVTTPEFKEDARQRFNQATKALGPLTQPIVDDVCLHGRSIAEVGQHAVLRRNRRDKDAQAITALRIGLELLEIHYGYVKRRRTL